MTTKKSIKIWVYVYMFEINEQIDIYQVSKAHISLIVAGKNYGVLPVDARACD